MVITIEGTKNGNNGAALCTSVLSSLAAIKRQKKVLVLQFMNRTAKNVEQYLIGQRLRDETFGTSVINLSEGMDSLMMLSDSQKITGPMFEESARPMVHSKTSNMFNVASSSNTDNIEADLMRKSTNADVSMAHDPVKRIRNMFESANSVYDLVFVLLPSFNETLCETAIPLADVNIVCVPQKRREPVYTCGKKTIYVCTDFDPYSKFNDKAMAKDYGTKVMYGLIHNSGFRDACAEGNVINFINNNCFNTKDDENYKFIYFADAILDSILGRSGKDGFDIESLEGRNVPEADEFVKKPMQKTEAITEVKGLFKKTSVDINTVSDNSNDPFVSRQQIPPKEYTKTVYMSRYSNPTDTMLTDAIIRSRSLNHELEDNHTADTDKWIDVVAEASAISISEVPDDEFNKDAENATKTDSEIKTSDDAEPAITAEASPDDMGITDYKPFDTDSAETESVKVDHADIAQEAEDEGFDPLQGKAAPTLEREIDPMQEAFLDSVSFDDDDNEASDAGKDNSDAKESSDDDISLGNTAVTGSDNKDTADNKNTVKEEPATEKADSDAADTTKQALDDDGAEEKKGFFAKIFGSFGRKKTDQDEDAQESSEISEDINAEDEAKEADKAESKDDDNLHFIDLSEETEEDSLLLFDESEDLFADKADDDLLLEDEESDDILELVDDDGMDILFDDESEDLF